MGPGQKCATMSQRAGALALERRARSLFRFKTVGRSSGARIPLAEPASNSRVHRTQALELHRTVGGLIYPPPPSGRAKGSESRQLDAARAPAKSVCVAARSGSLPPVRFRPSERTKAKRMQRGLASKGRHWEAGPHRLLRAAGG